MSILEITALTHVFSDGSTGIRDITLSVMAGEFLAIAGANGSGKTTLCRHLNGLLKPTSGTVLLRGKPVAEDLLEARRCVGMVFQNADAQLVGETVYNDVAFGPENLGLARTEIAQRVRRALELVELTALASQNPHRLSGGEKRRLAIAGILAMEPDVLVLDEPFANLDYPGSRHLLQQLVSLHQGGRTIILVTHDLEKIVAHIDRLILMHKGRIMHDGSPERIMGEVEYFGVKQPVSYKYWKRFESWLR